MPKRVPSVIQDIEAPVDVPVLAQAIVDLSEAVKQLHKLKLSRKAIIVLLAHDTGLNQRTITDVLEGIEGLRTRYTSL